MVVAVKVFGKFDGRRAARGIPSSPAVGSARVRRTSSTRPGLKEMEIDWIGLGDRTRLLYVRPALRMRKVSSPTAIRRPSMKNSSSPPAAALIESSCRKSGYSTQRAVAAQRTAGERGQTLTGLRAQAGGDSVGLFSGQFADKDLPMGDVVIQRLDRQALIPAVVPVIDRYHQPRPVGPVNGNAGDPERAGIAGAG